MTTISRISELAKIPEIKRKKREAMQAGKKRRKDAEERPAFPLKGKPCFKKPRTLVTKAAPEFNTAPPPASVEDGVGKKLDVKI
jgi:hypothetical protein